MAFLQRRRCVAPAPRTDYAADEVRRMICVGDDASAACLAKLGWKTLHNALTWCGAPNRGATKDLAARLAALFDARAGSPTCVAGLAYPAC